MSYSLNPYQHSAVLAEGHCTVLACPGSGKTSVIAQRAARILSENPKGRLCAVTFTKEAAVELEHRILQAASESSRSLKSRLLCGTFHSLAMKQLTHNKKTRRIRLLSNGERRSVLQRCCQSYDFEFDEAEKIIDYCKARLNPKIKDEEVREFYEAYESMLRNEGSLDFSDLLLHAVNGMSSKDIPTMDIKWMLVDEAQDMDEVQREWILLHGRNDVQITLVGDDDQSLYSFRHALGYEGLKDISFALNSLEVTLPINYRCAPNILAHAAKLIHHNVMRAHKQIQASKQTEGQITLARCVTREDETELMATAIKESLNRDSATSWFILARTNAILKSAELAIVSCQLPYRLVKSESVWDGELGSILLGLLRSIADGSWVGSANALAFAGVSSSNIDGYARIPGNCHAKLDVISMSPNTDAASKKIVLKLKQGLAAWSNQDAKNRSSLAIHGIVAFLKEYTKPHLVWLLEMMSNSLLKLNGTLGQRLAYIAMAKKNNESTTPPIQIMTLHASKGLEADCVWIMGVEEGNLPHADSTEDDERRLMYVGMTRARQRLVVSYASKMGDPSRFISEAELS